MPVSAGRLAGVLVWLCVAALLGVALYLAALASRQDSRVALLRHHGVPVDVVVTGCTGISSGVGMGIEYWECRGSFVLDGRSYDDVVINGGRRLLDAGRHVSGVAVPGRPDTLSTATTLGAGNSSGTEYGVAAGLAGAGVAAGAARVLAVRRRRPR